MTTNKNNTITYSFPAFTVAALVLLILKLTAYPTITWGTIFLVWLFPLLLVLGIMGVVLVVGAIMATCWVFYWLIFKSWRG